jgi:hypothetical protein
VRNSQAFLVVSFALGLKPSTTPLESLAFGAEPVEQKPPMSPQHPRDPFHRLDLRAHRMGAPVIQKAPGPVARAVAPEELKILLEQTAVGVERRGVWAPRTFPHFAEIGNAVEAASDHAAVWVDLP